MEFALKVINWDQKTEIRLQLWDIAGKSMLLEGMYVLTDIYKGQERFGNMTRVPFRTFFFFWEQQLTLIKLEGILQRSCRSSCRLRCYEDCYFRSCFKMEEWYRQQGDSGCWREADSCCPIGQQGFFLLLTTHKLIILFFQVDLAKEGFVKTPSQMDQYCKDNGFVGW